MKRYWPNCLLLLAVSSVVLHRSPYAGWLNSQWLPALLSVREPRSSCPTHSGQPAGGCPMRPARGSRKFRRCRVAIRVRWKKRWRSGATRRCECRLGRDRPGVCSSCFCCCVLKVAEPPIWTHRRLDATKSAPLARFACACFSMAHCSTLICWRRLPVARCLLFQPPYAGGAGSLC